ncbi:MAG TPA: DUF371 domain-containing protein [Methanomicrobia archaeon]|nr:DUF371 domain-containing protein [Methanomicrobia archaeon]
MIIIKAYGDPNIRATHKTTIEITKDDHLTERGDCILGIRADRGLKDIKNFLDSHKGKKLIVEFTVDDLSDRVTGYLDPRLSFLDERDIVIRKSSYICKRTLMINADKSAAEIDRSIVRKLREEKELIVRINSV